MIHMHYFELCFTKSRGFAGVRLMLGDYPRGLPFLGATISTIHELPRRVLLGT
jgi:hypothetical protein